MIVMALFLHLSFLRNSRRLPARSRTFASAANSREQSVQGPETRSHRGRSPCGGVGAADRGWSVDGLAVRNAEEKENRSQGNELPIRKNASLQSSRTEGHDREEGGGLPGERKASCAPYSTIPTSSPSHRRLR